MIGLDSTVRLLDFDGSVMRQEELVRRLDGHLDRLDFRSIGSRVRYFASRPMMRRIESRLRDEDRHRLTLMGSGDYHHMTAALLRRFTEPLSVVVFDTHPDWDRTSPWPCCGSWVSEILRRPNIRKVAMIGLGRCDLADWSVNWGDVRHLQSGRVAFYPYDCERSLSLGIRKGDIPCATFHPGPGYTEVRWSTVVSRPWDDLMHEVIDALPTDAVYLSIDKDSLRADAATTNWEEGGLSLDQLLRGIELLAAARTIVGADITGEYSPVTIANPLFRAIAAWGRPRLIPPREEDLALNGETNLRILEALHLLKEEAVP